MIKQLCTFILGLLTFHTEAALIPNQVTITLENYFNSKDLQIAPLVGGNSLSKNFLVSTQHRSYVLRFMEHKTNLRANAEIFSMVAADESGIGPKIYKTFPDQKMILMEYVDSLPWNDQQAQRREYCAMMAQVLRKVHSFPKNPNQDIARFEVMERFYKELSAIPAIQEYANQAITQVRSCCKALESVHGTYSATIHNDLNPGNILLTRDNKLLLIDWEGTNWEDPFYDLSYFAIMHGYDESHEMLLLSSYLDHHPGEDELSRYALTKKGNLARLAISCFYIAFVQCKGNVALDGSIKSLKEYIKIFSNKSYVGLSKEQFFYNFGRSFLNSI